MNNNPVHNTMKTDSDIKGSLIKNSLAQWQQHFSQSLLSDLSTPLKDSFNTHSDNESQQRFAIYQNNVFHSLTTALGDLYPVVKQLVGDEFFTGTASFYLRQEPPAQAAMVYFGQSFPQFLANFEHTSNMPYLAAIAKLELARHQAYHAEDKPSLSVTDFASMGSDQLAGATLTPHPSLQMISAPYAIFTIWQMHQQGNHSNEKIDINEPQQVLIVRPVYEVTVFSIDQSTYRFIELLATGNSISSAIETAIAEQEEVIGDNSFDPSTAINFLIEQQIFTHIN